CARGITSVEPTDFAFW
nr:immunoglobulin heavy chain junction region [Mus musculus]